MKKYAFLAALTVVGVANAQFTPQVAPQDMPEVTPDYVARVSADGRMLTPWIKVGKPATSGAEVPSWVLAHDNYAWNPVANTVNHTNYRNPIAPTFWFIMGTTAGSARANWPNLVNDTTLHSNAAVGQFVQLQTWAQEWNPAGKPFDQALGGTVTTNPRTAIILFFPVNTFGFGGTTVFSGATEGIAWQSTSLGEGRWRFTGPLTDAGGATLGFGLPMPGSRTGGGYLMQMATTDPVSGAIIPLPTPGTTQASWMSPMSATCPFQTGTNPSDSTEFAWVDTNANGSFSTAEYMNFQFTTGTNPGGNLSPRSGWAYDSAGAFTTGNVLYSSLATPPVGQPSVQMFSVIGVDAQGNLILNAAGLPVFDTQWVSVTPSGDYRLIWPKLADPTTGGVTRINTYKIQVKGTTWLRATSGIVDMSLGATGVNFTLINGDVNGDNLTDGLDLGGIDASFNLVPGDTGFNANADLNKDDICDGLDLAILDANFNMEGDTDLTLP